MINKNEKKYFLIAIISKRNKQAQIFHPKENLKYINIINF